MISQFPWAGAVIGTAFAVMIGLLIYGLVGTCRDADDQDEPPTGVGA